MMPSTKGIRPPKSPYENPEMRKNRMVIANPTPTKHNPANRENIFQLKICGLYSFLEIRIFISLCFHNKPKKITIAAKVIPTIGIKETIT